jgi:hypothetical protein
VHNEELHNLYFSQNIIRTIKLSRMKRAGNLASMVEGGRRRRRRGRRRMHTGYWRERQKERNHWEDLNAGGRITLRWTLEKWDGVVWIGFIWLMIGTREGLL